MAAHTKKHSSAGKRYICDCTMQEVDHLVSLSTRTKHRRHYPRRSKLPPVPLDSPIQEPLVKIHTDMMEDIQVNNSWLTDELNNEADDGLSIGLDDAFFDIIDEDEESASDTENGDDVLLELSASEIESSEDDNEVSDNDSVDDEEEVLLDDAANWELERLKALTG